MTPILIRQRSCVRHLPCARRAGPTAEPNMHLGPFRSEKRSSVSATGLPQYWEDAH